jgi:acyl-CoA synthetase (AMP-forming)/AMP-acid ligase II/thioesterase domain-containing protein/acyl carrier protein
VRTLELSPLAKAGSVGGSSAGQSTIGGEIQRLADLQPDHAAIVASGFAPLSYGELQFLAREVRAALRLGGFSRDARIAIAMPDSPQAALAIVAVACSAVSIPLNPRQTLSEIETCFAAVRPDAVLLVKGADSAAKSAAESKGLAIIEVTQAKEGTLAFDFARPKTGIKAPPHQPDEPDSDAPAFILQTSGTSAVPKLVPYSHRNMLATAAIAKAWYNLTPQDRCLSVSPVFYAHGLKVTVLTPLLTGGTVTFPTDASKFDYSEWFDVLKPTWFSAGPTLHRFIFDQMQSRADAKVGHSLRFITVGLAAASRDLLEGLQYTLGVPVLACYGASEASVISSNQPPPGRSKVGTVGLPWPDTVVIASEDGHRLPSGQLGDILVGGPTVISGYLNAPELNRTRFVDGWFNTGDIGSVDEQGFLTVHGRKDDLINRGGEKISPLEIDDALMRHPAIAEAAAFAVPHPRLGEDVAAAVVLRPGMTLRPVEIRGYLQEQLASFKVPRRIVLYDQLPKGQTGKILRRQLAETLVEDTAAETKIAPPQLVEDVDSDLVLQLREIWERLLKIAPLSVDDDFFENGGDSLLAMEMIAELERVTGRSVSGSILFEVATIRQLAQKLSEHAHLNEKPKALIRLNSSGSRTPLFFFHSDVNGEGYSAARLARLLGFNQPFFVIAPHGMGFEPVPRSIEAMAADRLPLIMDAQPEGPYRLFGSCVGGLVAFEVARLLVAAGRKVDMVIMLDPPVISARRSVQLLFAMMRRARPLAGPVVDRAMAWTFLRCAELDRFCKNTWARRWSGIKSRMKNVARGRISPSVERSFEEAAAKRDATYEVAMSNYVPKPLAVPVIYFSVDYRGEALRRISSDLEIIKSPGNHFQLDYNGIAKHLLARLAAGNVSTRSRA